MARFESRFVRALQWPLLTIAAALAAAGCGISTPLPFELEGDEPPQEVNVSDDAGADAAEPAAPPPEATDAATDAQEPDATQSMTGTGQPEPERDAGPPPRRPCGTGPGCDPTDLGGESCESLGLGHGTLLCEPVSCTFLLNLCEGLPQDASTGRPCGTGPGCNPDDLGGATCQSLGRGAGALSCDRDTCELDLTACGAASTGGVADLLSLFTSLFGGLFGGAGATSDAGAASTPGAGLGGLGGLAGLLDGGLGGLAGLLDGGLSGLLDAGLLDGGLAGLLDAGLLDGGLAGLLDAGLLDAGLLDAGRIDGGFGGLLDAGLLDGGRLDAGNADAGNPDAGSTDAGFDAGAIDAGRADAGEAEVDAAGSEPDPVDASGAGEPDAGAGPTAGNGASDDDAATP